MAYLFFAILIIAALIGVGLRKIPPNTQWNPVLFGRRLEIRITEGWTWLPWGIFTLIPVDTREDRLDLLVKQRQYERPDNFAPGSEEPYQAEETILAPDGLGEGAAYIHVSNVAVQFHVTKSEPGSLPWWMKPLTFFGWKPGKLLMAYTSIDRADIVQRLRSITLHHLRLIYGNIPFQLSTNLPLKIGDKMPTSQERLAARQQANRDLCDAVNAEVNPWGMTVTAIPIGDIDPDKAIMDSLQAVSAARFHREQVNIAMAASVDMLKQLFGAANHTPTAEDMLKGYTLIETMKNQGRASENGIVGMQLFEQLRGLISTTVNVTPPPPTPPPAPPTPPLPAANPVAA